jgi:hypothetical protein
MLKAEPMNVTNIWTLAIMPDGVNIVSFGLGDTSSPHYYSDLSFVLSARTEQEAAKSEAWQSREGRSVAGIATAGIKNSHSPATSDVITVLTDVGDLRYGPGN